MAFFERYRFQEFAWFPTKDLEKGLEHLEYGAAALHASEALKGPEELEKLLDVMMAKVQVKALFIPKCGLGDNGCRILADFLAVDRCLKYLFIEENNVTTKGCMLILQGLKKNKTLKTLMMGANKIDDDGARAVAEFLRENESIKELALGTELTDKGAMFLAKGLTQNSTLKSLYLLNNHIDKTGAEILSQVIGRHPSLDNAELVSKKVSLEQFQNMFKSQTEQELKAAFEAAVFNNEDGPWMRSKIMVVGQGRAGKTATVRSLLGLSFDPELDSTVGASISQSTTKNSNNQWNKVSENAKFDFALDTASRITALKIARRRNKEAEMLQNFDIDKFVEEYKKLHDDQQLEDEELLRAKQRANAIKPTKDGKTVEDVAASFDATLVTNKNAELDDISFTIWDYGGQQVFYTLHHLFLTRYGIYLLAFDMREVVCKHLKKEEDKRAARKQTTEYLQFWLNSVYMHASEAPLLLIGTFLDEINTEEELKFVNDFIKKLVHNKFEQVVQNDKMYFFPLNNKSPNENIAELVDKLGGSMGRNIEIIRDTIENVARNEEFVNQQLSLRWMKCLDNMLSEKDSYLKLPRVREIAKEVGITSPAEVDKMLFFFHELGMIVHLTSTQNLREFITTKPQWLVDALSKVIRDERLHRFNEEEIKRAGLVKDLDLMFKKCIVTSDWLEYLWQKDQVPFLVDLMRRTMLISDWKFGEFSSETAYLVPSLIQAENQEHMKIAEEMLLKFNPQTEEEDTEENSDTKHEKEDSKKAYDPFLKTFAAAEEARSIVFDFSKSFLPNGVFQRMLCLCIFHSTREKDVEKLNGKDYEPDLYRTSAVIYMGGGQVFELFKHDLQIICKVKKDHIKAYRMLQSMMRKMKVDVMGKGLDWDVYLDVTEVPNEDGSEVKETLLDKKGTKLHKFVLYDDAKTLQLPPWFEKERAVNDEVKEEMGVNLEDFLQELEAM